MLVNIEKLNIGYSIISNDLIFYGQDWTRAYAPNPSAVLFPESLDQVLAIVRWANVNRIALVPSGGRTGLSGGAVAANAEVVVSFERMNKILDFNEADASVTVQAGVTTQAVQEFAASKGLYYPVDFASRGSSQIGGNIATNAGGIRVLRYGLTRQWVSGLEVVTGAGDCLRLNNGLIKNASGPDLRHLIIGSEGTLALICHATLQLIRSPAEQQVMVLAVPNLEAMLALLARARHMLTLSAFEFFSDNAMDFVVTAGAQRPFSTRAPFYALLEYDQQPERAASLFEQVYSDGLVSDGVISQSHAQSAALWRLRENITECISPRRPYKNDISVRVHCVPEFVCAAQALFEREYPGVEIIWFGHIGDGNLHISILPPVTMKVEHFQELAGKVTEHLAGLLYGFGGSISAEHGIGLLKKPYAALCKDPAELAMMAQLKALFDPNVILNPGKVYP